MAEVEIREPITPAIKALCDNIAKCGQYSRDNPTVPLKDNPYFDEVREEQLLIAAFGMTDASCYCPGCGITHPQITKDLRTNCSCRSSEVIVVRTVGDDDDD